MKYSSMKEINQYVKNLVGLGWKFKRGKKHGRLILPGSSGIIIVACSPSDKRSLLNLKQNVRNLIKLDNIT